MSNAEHCFIRYGKIKHSMFLLAMQRIRFEFVVICRGQKVLWKKRKLLDFLLLLNLALFGIVMFKTIDADIFVIVIRFS